jgi:hypothetical protein
MEEFKPDISNYERLITKSGEEAFLLVQNNGANIAFDGMIIHNGIEFHLRATMHEDFYQQYSEVVNQMFLNVTFNE